MDYTDFQRVNNVQLAKNVKIVEPNVTIIYACPVILGGTERISPVFVTPKVLSVGEGDILCSPQAGGIMHKIVKEYTDGIQYFQFDILFFLLDKSGRKNKSVAKYFQYT